MKKIDKKIIFASGGTGGHIFPAIGVMQHFIKQGYKVKMVTDSRGEQYIKNNLEVRFYILNTDTPFNKRNYKKFISYTKIFFSIIKSLFFLKSEKPNIVFGLGGYASFPICIAAKILNIPLVIYENNYVLGRANKFLLPFSKKIFTTTNEIHKFPEKYKKKVIKVGHILREEVINYSQVSKQNIDAFFSIIVLGGSQGAEIFGLIIPTVIKKINEMGHKIKIYHQCIKKQKESLINFYKKNKIQNEVFEFSNNILKYILESNLAITRCGASTTAELIYTKTPFIAVPYPHSMDNHQYFNAVNYENKGYCWMLEQSNFNEENLFNLILKILKDKKNLELKTENMRENFDKDTNQNIEKEVNKILQI